MNFEIDKYYSGDVNDYDSLGNLIKVTTYTDGIKNGLQKKFYENGNIRKKRLNSKVRVEKSMEVKQIGNDKVKVYLKMKN